MVQAVRIPVQAVGGLSIEQAVQCPEYGAPLVVLGDHQAGVGQGLIERERHSRRLVSHANEKPACLHELSRILEERHPSEQEPKERAEAAKEKREERIEDALRQDQPVGGDDGDVEIDTRNLSGRRGNERFASRAGIALVARSQDLPVVAFCFKGANTKTGTPRKGSYAEKVDYTLSDVADWMKQGVRYCRRLPTGRGLFCWIWPEVPANPWTAIALR